MLKTGRWQKGAIIRNMCNSGLYSNQTHEDNPTGAILQNFIDRLCWGCRWGENTNCWTCRQSLLWTQLVAFLWALYVDVIVPCRRCWAWSECGHRGTNLKTFPNAWQLPVYICYSKYAKSEIFGWFGQWICVFPIIFSKFTGFSLTIFHIPFSKYANTTF